MSSNRIQVLTFFLTLMQQVGFRNAVKIHRAWRKEGITDVDVKGRTIRLRNKSSDLVLFSDIILKREYSFKFKVRPEPVIIDAGANIGLATLAFRTEFPNGSVIAIEPDNGNFQLLKHNFAHDGRVKVLNKAVWYHNDGISLDTSSNEHWSYSTKEAASAGAKTGSITPQQIFADYNLDFADIVKFDIEGAEYDIFRNSKDFSWLYRISYLVIEFHDWMKDGTAHSFLEVLFRLGIKFNLYPLKEKVVFHFYGNKLTI